MASKKPKSPNCRALFTAWAFATDGKVISFVEIGLDDACPFPRCPEKFVAKAKMFMEPSTPPVRSLPTDKLKEWAAKPEFSQPCPACLGRSKESEFVSCSFCDDDGTMSPDRRFGWLCGVLIDCNLLAKGLQGVSGSDAAVYCREGECDKPVQIVGHSWRVAIMPINSTNVDSLELQKVKGSPI